MGNPVGNEIIYAQGIGSNGMPAATTEPFTLAQIAGLSSVDSAPTVETVVSNTIGTTLAAAALVGGQVNRSGPTASYTDTTDTAANIIAALPGFLVNSQFYVVFKNTTTFSQTLAAGVGVTLPGTVLVPALAESTYFATIGGTSGSPTVVFTHVGTVGIHTSQSVAAPAATTLSTVGAATLTAASIFGGVTIRSGAQSATAFTDTTDTAANIITLIGAGSTTTIGQSSFYIYENTTNAPATIAGGTGVTVSGVTIVPANSSVVYLVTYTAAATVTMVGLGSTNVGVGTFTANGITAVVVANTAVSPNSVIVMTLKTIGGTPAGSPYLSAVTAGTGFSVKTFAGDTSVYNYAILG